jgi:hypothetical protein
MALVRKADLPLAASIAGLYPGADLADAYEIDLPLGLALDAEALARSMLERPPAWYRQLLGLRDLLVRGFGLKTAAALAVAGAADPARHIDLFRIFSKSAPDIVLGQDDRHLDFRLSCLRLHSSSTDAAPVRSTLIVTTVVHCHNRFGRVYIALITPFHRLVVRSLLQRAARLGWGLG